jgi:hypothetical protein
MNVVISDYHETDTCTWCEKQEEAVTVTFDSGFLKHAPVCWKCLQKAVRVHHKQQSQTKVAKGGSPPTS